MRYPYFIRYYSTFPWAIPLLWAGYSRVTRPSATVHLSFPPEDFYSRLLVRLACVRHAASVRPEPGSNSRSLWSLFVRITSSVCSSKSAFASLKPSPIHQVLLSRFALLSRIYTSHTFQIILLTVP